LTIVVRARKSLGQNFLADPNYQRKILEAIAPDPQDEVLEIGPGTGALTAHLAPAVRTLVAVEIDDRLAPELERQFQDQPGVRIVHGDMLDIAPESLFDDLSAVTVVGNIPYYITSPLIFHLLEREQRPARIILMVQREVADRLAPQPGGKAYGALTVGVRSVARVERLFHVPRGAFRPVPNVDSSVVSITPIRPTPFAPGEETDLRTLVRTAFGWRRKQLQRTLRTAPGYGLEPSAITDLEAATGIDLTARPEALDVDQLVALSRALRRAGLPAETAA
jgi:16S rRNA (adenine1518-N6/adenine1519-N6)-dimethyltransferase